MNDHNPISHTSTGRSPLPPRVDKNLTALVVWPTIVLTIGLTALGAHQGSALGAVAVAWLMWFTLAILFGTRTLWQPSFLMGSSRFQRARRFFGRWYGWTGLATSVLLLVAWVVFAPITWLNGYVAAAIAAGAAALLFVRGLIRHIAMGVLVIAPAPLWIFAAIAAVVFLALPAIVYLITVGISTLVLRNRRAAASA